jgi:creatinine amidohydrolase/Fe(II)-dependent formamide hydrolase-like protein
VLPPLYHEALDADLKAALLARIGDCVPYFAGTGRRAAARGRLEVVELPPARPPQPARRPPVVAFSVDTTVEQHGPHLPLATDMVQSYAVLERLAAGNEAVVIGPSADYGQLTWGLPFGFSVDITAPLTARYVRGFADAVLDWLEPEALYVVDVHGSAVHRQAIQDGLRQSRCRRWAFRWLHDPLVSFSAERGDPHAGGVETALIEHISRDFVDPAWWPGRVDELVAGQMTAREAIALSADLPHFCAEVEARPVNGIVGDLRNYFTLDAAALMQRMLDVAREDVAALST